MKYYLGIDLGGTNTTGGLLDEKRQMIASKTIKTNLPKSAEEVIEDIASLAEELLSTSGISREDVQWLGIGTPGVVDSDAGIIFYSTNFDFYKVNLKLPLEKRLGLPVYVDNDANAAAYGQYLVMGEEKYQSFIAVTLGTGVGGGVIIDGKMLKGFNHSAGELGHMVIKENGHPCSCGRKGCLEQYASATALVRQTKVAMQQHPESLLWKLCDGDLEKVSGRSSFEAAKQGDPVAKHVVDKYIHSLACGIINFVNIFQPEAICICGGISREGEIILQPIREMLKKEDYGRYSPAQTELYTDQLGVDAGVIGAAFLGNLYKKN